MSERSKRRYQPFASSGKRKRRKSNAVPFDENKKQLLKSLDQGSYYDKKEIKEKMALVNAKPEPSVSRQKNQTSFRVEWWS